MVWMALLLPPKAWLENTSVLETKPKPGRPSAGSLAGAMVLALIFSLVYGLLGNTLLWVFTDQQEVIEAAGPFLFWMALFPLLSTPCYIWDGIFIGLTAVKAMRNSMLLAVIIYLLAFYLLDDYWEHHGLWLSLLIYMVARGLFQQYLYYRKGLSLS